MDKLERMLNQQTISALVADIVASQMRELKVGYLEDAAIGVISKDVIDKLQRGIVAEVRKNMRNM